jgi:hypothetical protein
LKLILLVLALLVCGVSAPDFQGVDKSQTEPGNTLCVVDGTGLPVPVRFENSITLSQVIKQAGIVREDIKNRVFVFRRLQTNTIQPIQVDLKRIEKGAPDLTLDQHDIVYVESRKKQSPADREAIGRSCVICGLTSVQSMHGGLFLMPKEWRASYAPAEKTVHPNNQKP